MFHCKDWTVLAFGGGCARVCSVSLEGLPFNFSDYVCKYNFIP